MNKHIKGCNRSNGRGCICPPSSPVKSSRPRRSKVTTLIDSAYLEGLERTHTLLIEAVEAAQNLINNPNPDSHEVRATLFLIEAALKAANEKAK